jgi:hypothetical protein
VFGEHPPAFGNQHPWVDPLAPQDLFNPRPDAELAMAGGLAPNPQDFPFTPEGRAQYYNAVRSMAHQMQAQQMHSQHLYAQEQAVAAAQAEAHRRASFLLLCP